MKARSLTFCEIMEPTYFARPIYEAIAAAHGATIEDVQAAHRSLCSAWIEDDQLNPKELALVNAIRAHLDPPKPIKVEEPVVAAPIESKPKRAK